MLAQIRQTEKWQTNRHKNRYTKKWLRNEAHRPINSTDACGKKVSEYTSLHWRKHTRVNSCVHSVNDDLKCQGDIYYTSADNMAILQQARNERLKRFAWYRLAHTFMRLILRIDADKLNQQNTLWLYRKRRTYEDMIKKEKTWTCERAMDMHSKVWVNQTYRTPLELHSKTYFQFETSPINYYSLSSINKPFFYPVIIPFPMAWSWN